MKGFEREDQLFSLCGLNWRTLQYASGRVLSRVRGRCRKSGVCDCTVCYAEGGYTDVLLCMLWEFQSWYAEPDAYDSFITHRNRMQDFMRMHTIGAAAYHKEQLEKIEILKELLSDYNDGRRKTLFTLAVNLLELKELRGVMQRLSEVKTDTYTRKEKAELAASLLQEAAAKIPAELKLRKKPKQKSVG